MFKKASLAASLTRGLLASVVVLCLMVAPLGAAQEYQSPQHAPTGRVSSTAYPNPNGGSANVDGNPAEWDLAVDFFADMYRAGNPNSDVLSKLYLRYDCAASTLYLLVLAEPGSRIESFHNQEENWAKVNNQMKVNNLSGGNGVPPDFSYVNSNGTHADGWEASFSIASGSYTNFNVHTQVNDGNAGGQTSAVSDRRLLLTLDCTCLGSIGDYIWHDADGQGDQDEPAANGLANVRVRLLNAARTQVLDVKTTNADGYYLFSDLTAGGYMVDVNEQDVIDLYGLPTLTTNNEPYPYSLAAGEHHRRADFGYWAPPGKVALGDYVWHDFNSNGQQDFPAEAPASAGVQCISVFLYDSAGNYLKRTDTDSWGVYMFYDLLPGTYTTVVHASDPDLEQINGTRSCGLNDGTPPVSLTQRAPLAVYFTTVTNLTFGVSPAGTINRNFDFGINSTPLAVILAGFNAQQIDDYVRVNWETVTETGSAGFNLYRSEGAAGPQALLAYVPSQAPGSTQGAAYSYDDLGVQAGQTTWYWLEDVDLSGATTRHGPVSVAVQAPTAVTLGGISASPAASAPLPWLWVATGAGAALAVGRRRR